MFKINEDVNVPEGVDVSIGGKRIRVAGEKGELNLDFFNPRVKIVKENNKIFFMSDKATRREKRIIGTFKAHVNNMIKGVREGFEYRLKICASHFPMNVSIDGKAVVIKNFLGEKIPRKAKILEGVDGKIDGDQIILTGISRENVGQTAANIEKSCKIGKRDRRRFEDGIYIISKGEGLI